MSLVKTLCVMECICIALFFILSFTHKMEVLAFRPAFGGFALSLLVLAVCGLVGVVLVFMAIFSGLDNIGMKSLVSVLGLAPLVSMFLMVGKDGFSAPRIHNITTTPNAGFEFEHAHRLRKPGENSVELPSSDVLDQQKRAYPELQPLTVMESPQETYAQVLLTARDLGWQITFENKDALRFEAMDETKFFGFKDDVLVVVTERESDGPDEKQSLIHVRSVSRVGVSDLGANVKRIHVFFEKFKAQHNTY